MNEGRETNRIHDGDDGTVAECQPPELETWVQIPSEENYFFKNLFVPYLLSFSTELLEPEV